MSAIGLVCALALEARTVPRARGRELVVSGVGPERARRAADALVARGARALVSWGLAGGLDPALGAGALLVPAAVLGRDGRRFETDAPWSRALCARLALAGGATLVESERALATPAEKRALFEASRAAAVDMESAAVAARAREAGLPFVAVRAVCDAAGAALPRAALEAVVDGRPRAGRLVAALAARPGELAPLLALWRAARAAARALHAAARALGPELALPGGA